MMADRDEAGRFLPGHDLAGPEHRRADLWNATQHARATQLAYDRAIGAPNRHGGVHFSGGGYGWSPN